ncbi:gamma-glutamyltransferase family protein [Virgibacillus sp. 179-BFC.A HS]|uniref:Gamma-glutamyltransferase family protein n=1 Tax=Tigheibacillus jepli TaxID=3035914 RepID=A0ABU5CK69_9BACI|nr:gamma-glutamyltransferase family protein [Virgibacillus sp. 179-BFC.A HS]MDY0406746.1 gamma-glutamyltransferase family protein [Virgibacillus sp. 179-BFC.A HS]
MFSFNHQKNPYPITKNATYAKNGMVATSQPLAAQAGLDILKKGGNAIDAAIATAACLTVVEPTSNGIGGDAFAIVWVKDKLFGMNGSGRSPQSISIEAIKELGHEEIPKYGWIPVTVPGAPGLWADLSKKFGKLPLTDVLKPAITYAVEGFPISPTLGRYWNIAFNKFRTFNKSAEFQAWFDTFAPKGRAPRVGEIWSSLDHAETLSEIAETNAASFYHGNLAEKMVAFSKQSGGFLRAEDLASHQTESVEPLSVNYHGYDVWELPPNSQGIIALQALNILNGFDFSERDNVDTLHKQIEALKLAFADGFRYLTDENFMNIDSRDLISESYGDLRRKQITETAAVPEAGEPVMSGTVYLATADFEGNMVSFIQSNYMGFGAGLVVPGTGIALQNRGHNFSMDSNHVNALKGGKRTLHTIIPGFLTKNGQPIGPFGVMGGFMMPQGHVQLLMNAIDFDLNPQAALDAPRFQWLRDKIVEVEPRFAHHLAVELADRGHDVRIAMEPNSFGRGQMIWRDSKTGVMCGGTESRTDGSIASW